MTARLLAAWAVVLACLVLPAGPAAASCVGIDAVLEGDPPVVFVGVVQRRLSDDGRVIARFRVDRVHSGEVHRTQYVLVPAEEVPSSGVDWSDGDRVLVLGNLDAEGRITTNGCMSVTQGSEEFAATVRELGEGAKPLEGVDRIERDGLARRDFLRPRSVVALAALVGLGLVAARRIRRRRA